MVEEEKEGVEMEELELEEEEEELEGGELFTNHAVSLICRRRTRKLGLHLEERLSESTNLAQLNPAELTDALH